MKGAVCPPQAALPQRRWAGLFAATLLMLCVYYLNYGASFEEGDVQGGGGPWVLAGRLAAVALIVASLRPFRFRADTASLLALLYVASACSLLLSIGVASAVNDLLFINTLLQLPVLLALAWTVWRVDFARWLRFIGCVLALQVLGDAVLWLNDASLWLSQAFVGGLGNPSSFGLMCSVLYAFCLFSPDAGRWRVPLALLLGLGALFSKALFAVLAVGILSLAWVLRDWRRAAIASVAVPVAALAVLTFLLGEGDDEVGFIEHKLSAVGALLGVMDYDIESSASVALRLDMHRETAAALASEPMRLLWGHLEGRAYWPMDSQILTYLGSFGLPMLLAFLALHLLWLAAARKLVDGGFCAWSLGLMGLIFLTNRILDYFPVAALYFMLIALATSARSTHRDPVRTPASPLRLPRRPESSTPRMPAGLTS